MELRKSEYAQGYVDATCDILRTLDDILVKDLETDRVAIYRQLNPMVDLLVKNMLACDTTSWWVRQTAEKVKCAMCDRGK